MFSTGFCGLWVKIKNMILCTKMNRIIKVLKRERARRYRRTLEITMSNILYC